MMNPYVSKSFKYAILPGILPRLKEFDFNFGFIAYLMAIIFSAIRLLPANHPYLYSANFGKYSIRQVLAAAAHQLGKPRLKNIDQYIIFMAFVLGATLLVAMFGLGLFLMVTNAANAAAIPVLAYFHTANPATDVAFMMLDIVFQIPGFFFSSAAPPTDADISPFAQGLHVLFGYYNRGMLLVASLIIMYYIFVVIVETAQTGVPFGERFDSVYVPIRIILALILLVPTSYGLSTGQYLALSAAKWGSGFATNAWLIHNNLTGDNPLGLTTQELVSRPKIEDIGSLVRFFELASACESAYRIMYGKTLDAYVVRPGSGAGNAMLLPNAAGNLGAVKTFTGNHDIRLVIGEQNANYTQYPGNIKPYCGQIAISLENPDLEGVEDIYSTYFDFFVFLWYDPDLIDFGDKSVYVFQKNKGDACAIATTVAWGTPCAVNAGICECGYAGPEFYVNTSIGYQALFEVQMDAILTNIQTSTPVRLAMTQPILDLGWGGAGVWFSRIAEYNGAVTAAAMRVPTPYAMPAVMEFVSRKKATKDKNTTYDNRFSPNIPTGSSLDEYWKDSKLDNPQIDMSIAKFLDEIYRNMDTSDIGEDPYANKKSKSFLDHFLTYIFGASGLFEFRNNTDVHPMARISTLGKTIIEKAITFIGASFLMSGFGGLIGAANSDLGQGISTTAGVISTFGFSALTAGFVFYYILPMMPFMYFFFAVARWVKTVFEAMVGVPLWALAHLKIDGPGIPAQAAANGYFLLLEIFVRPILTLFGLLLSFSIFSALVAVLDGTFNLVVSNVGGNAYDPADASTLDLLEVTKSKFDEFMYTIMYVIIVYMIATSSFKLIDLIPNGILRFIGAGVSSFGDKAPDPLQSMVQYTAVIGAQQTERMAGAVTSAGRAIGTGAGGMAFGGEGAAAGPAAKMISEMRERMKNQ